MAGHRFDTFDCGDRRTNRWLRTASRADPARLKVAVVSDGPLVRAFVALNVSVRKRRLRRPLGWIELVSFGVDREFQGQTLVRLLLSVTEAWARSGDLTDVPALGIIAFPYTDAGKAVLRRRRFDSPDGRMFLVRFG